MRMIRFEAARDQIAMSEKENAAFSQGVEAVTSIRCANHRHVATLNTNEAADGECPICEIDTLVAGIDYLIAALKRAHACATLRDDGTCAGCFVSEAIAKAETR